MLHLARTFLILCTATAAFVASSLQGKVLCIGEEGHAAVEPPHSDAACAADHDAHEHEQGDGREPDDGDCSDVSADLLAARDSAATAVDLSHHQLDLLPPPAADFVPVILHLSRPRVGLGTHPPSDALLASLRSVILVI